MILLATVIVMGSQGAETDSRIRELEIKVKKLEEQPKQIKIESTNETRKVEKTAQVIKPSTNRVVSVSGGCEQYRPLVSQYAWNVETAMRVMDYESGGGLDGNCDPNAANRTDRHKDSLGNLICIGSFGLFQISCHAGEVYDPAQNVALAWGKYQYGGWYQPWRTTCNKIGCTL